MLKIKILVGVFFAITMMLGSGCGFDGVQKENVEQKVEQNTVETKDLKGKRILVAYFSWSGHTKKVAETIQQKVGGDLFEIKTVKAYPRDHQSTSEIAKKEQEENARPELSDKVSDMDNYDVVLLGYPMWWYTAPMAVDTFLESYNFTGKTILPFCTTGGSEINRSVDEIRDMVKDARVMEGLTVLDVNDLSRVDSWLKKSGLL